MGCRLDLAPDKSFEVTIKGLLKDIDSIKKAQIVGASSLISNYTKTGNVWDINGVAVLAWAQTTYRVTFTPNPNQNPKPYTEFIFTYGIGNMDGWETVQWYPDPLNTTDDTTRAYIFIFTNDSNNVTLYTRFGVKSSHTGTLGIVKLT
jgi:hypothetical protein